MTSFVSLKEDVIETGLCVHCGTCVGVCPVNALDIADVLGRCEPHQVGSCIECGLCVQTCPGKTVDCVSLSKKWPDIRKHPMLGQFSKIFVGCSRDENIRRRGASGGMGTEILLHLMQEEAVDGVVVLDFSITKPWFPEVKIVTKREEIIRAAQSKYFIYPQNTILRDFRESCANKIAFFGLPCQVHGIRKAIQARVPGTEKIKYIIGSYCGNNLFYEATLSLFKRFKFYDKKEIRRVAYRDGEYPGGFVVKGKNKKMGVVDKFTFNYLSFFYTPFRCLFCIDPTNELADISIGDAWRGTYFEMDKQGHSVVIVRNPELVSLFEQGMKEGHYEIEQIPQKEAIRMHANVLDNKKVGAFARMNIWQNIGRDVPDYFVNRDPISLKRSCLEMANLALLSVCSKKISRDLVSTVPLKLLAPLLRFIRGTWRKKAARSYARSRSA